MRARIRSVKPEFFQDGDLYDAEVAFGLPLRIAFEGLWAMSDREGRFEWKPRELKLNILPYDPVDMAAVLVALTTRGFVVRYQVDGKDYGWVRTFKRHQSINNRESDSTLPPPPPELVSRVEDASGTREGPAPAEGKGTELNGAEGKETSSAASQPAPGSAAVVEERVENRAADPFRLHLSAITGAIRHTWWAPDEQPPDGWSVEREISIWRQFLEAGKSVDDCSAVIVGARLLQEAGSTYWRAEPIDMSWLQGEKLTARVFNRAGAGDLWEHAFAAYTQGPPRPTKGSGTRGRPRDRPTHISKLTHGPPAR